MYIRIVYSALPMTCGIQFLYKNYTGITGSSRSSDGTLVLLLATFLRSTNVCVASAKRHTDTQTYAHARTHTQRQ